MVNETLTFEGELTTLKQTAASLTSEHVLLPAIHAVIVQTQLMKKKQRMSDINLTTGLKGINDVMREINNNNIEELLNALNKVEQFKKQWARAKFRRNVEYFIIAVATLLVSSIIVLAALQFPPALLLPTILLAMNTIAIPGIPGALPAFTVGNIVLNMLIGAGIGLVKPPLWKYAKITFRTWRFDRAVHQLEKTIEEQEKHIDTEIMALHAKILLTEIKHLSQMGNQIKSLYKLTECLEAVTAVLKHPTNLNALQHVAHLADNISPISSTLNKAYKLFLASLAPIATLAVLISIPLAAIQSVGYMAHMIAVKILSLTIPYSSIGLEQNSAFGLMIINNELSAMGERSVELPNHIENTPGYIERLKNWLGYASNETVLFKAKKMTASIKELKQGRKSTTVKAEVMRDSLQTFKEKFNAIAQSDSKPIIPSHKK